MHANRVSQLRPFLPPAATSDVERSKGARAFRYVYLRIPTRFLEESKGAFADILAKVSLKRDQPAWAALNTPSWVRQRGQIPRTAESGPGVSPNCSHAIAIREPH